MKKSLSLMLFVAIFVSQNLLARPVHNSLYSQNAKPSVDTTSAASGKDRSFDNKAMEAITKANYITDDKVNKVFTSSLLPLPSSGFDAKVRVNLFKRLQAWAGEAFTAITHTKDVWMRDFMPIQITKDMFVDYTYAPDYLSDAPECVTEWWTLNVGYLKDKKVLSLPITLDGGNVVKAINKEGIPCMIMCDKVLVENKLLSEKELLVLQENGKFEANTSVCRFKKWWKEWWKDKFNGTDMELILLPWEGSKINPIGHADGMIRYVSPGKLLMTNYRDFDEQQRDFENNTLKEEEFSSTKLREILENAGFDVDELSYYNKKRYNDDKNYKEKFDLSWCYINYLQLGHRILVPRIGCPAVDEEARRQIEKAFNENGTEKYTCESIDVDMTSIVTEPEHWANSENGGGALNCLTWTICE